MPFDLGLGTLLGGVVSGIGSLVGNAYGASKSTEAVALANRGNLKLADKAYEYNLDMWNRQNEYNSPIQQMQRLKDAGLNPNLMYGQGNVGNASSAPSYDTPQMQAYTGFGDFGASAAGNQLMNAIQGYANIKKTEEETNLIRQNTQNMELQAKSFELRNIYQGYLNNMASDKSDVYKDLLRSEIANRDSSTFQNYSSGELNKTQKDYTQSQLERFEMLTPLVYQQTETSVKQALFDLFHLSNAKLNNILADTKVKNAMARLTDLNGTAIFNEIEFGEKSVSWNLYKREYDSVMMEFEKAIQSELQRSGINLKGSNWFTPLLHLIEKEIALPIDRLFSK